MGDVVGCTVGTRVGRDVGAFVGECVGNDVGTFVGASVGAFVGAFVGAAEQPLHSEAPWPSHPHPAAQEHCLKEHVASPHAHRPLPAWSHCAHSAASHPPGAVGEAVGIFVGLPLGGNVGLFVGGSVGHASPASSRRIASSDAYSARMYGCAAGMPKETLAKYSSALPLPIPMGTMRSARAFSASIAMVRSRVVEQRFSVEGLLSVRNSTICFASARRFAHAGQSTSSVIIFIALPLHVLARLPPAWMYGMLSILA